MKRKTFTKIFAACIREKVPQKICPPWCFKKQKSRSQSGYHSSAQSEQKRLRTSQVETCSVQVKTVGGGGVEKKNADAKHTCAKGCGIQSI